MSEEKKTSQAEQHKTSSDPRLERPEVAAGLLRTTKIVIWAGLGLLIVALSWWGIVGKLTHPPVVLGAIGALGVIFWMTYNLRALRAVAGTRAAKLVVNSVGFILFVLGIIVCLNIIVVRHHPRLDLTQNKIYSLAPQSMAVLKGLTKDVEMIAFLPKDSGGPSSAADTVRLYPTVSPRVKVTWADYTDVALSQEYKVTVPGTVVVKSGDKQEKVTDVSEQRLTSAILSVTTDTKTVLYFLAGEGEDSTSGGENGISTLKSDLDNQQYVVKELDLAKLGATPAIPSDCGVLVIIGAKQAPAPQEMAAIETYVDNKGKLLLALAPPPAPDFASILGKRGVTVLNGVVLEPDQTANYFGQRSAPVAVPKPGSPIGEGVDKAVMLWCRGMKVQAPSQPPAMPGAPPPPSGPASAVLESSATSYLVPKVESAQQKPANAPVGPFALGAVIDETPPPPEAMPGQPPPAQQEQDATRIVVLGSNLALSDGNLQIVPFNGYLALNSVAWLSKNVRLISIPPETDTPHNLLLTSAQKNFIIFVVLLFIPLGVIIAGVSVWWTRRR